MTFDRNPKSVQFIQPNVLDRACLSVGKHDGFADQFGLHRTVLIQIFDARRITDGIARPCSAQPSVLSKAAQRRRLSQCSAMLSRGYTAPAFGRTDARRIVRMRKARPYFYGR